MTEPKRPVRQPGYRLEMIDDELLLYHPAQTKILYCNRTASLIWELCSGEHTVEGISSLLCEVYPGAAASIPDDVKETLAQFAKHGAIEYV